MPAPDHSSLGLTRSQQFQCAERERISRRVASTIFRTFDRVVLRSELLRGAFASKRSMATQSRMPHLVPAMYRDSNCQLVVGIDDESRPGCKGCCQWNGRGALVSICSATTAAIDIKRDARHHGRNTAETEPRASQCLSPYKDGDVRVRQHLDRRAAEEHRRQPGSPVRGHADHVAALVVGGCDDLGGGVLGGHVD